SAEQDADRKAAAAKKATYKYPRPADVQLGVFNEARWARALAGEAHVVRFVMPRAEIRVQDEILGEVKFASGEVDDFVIRKQDGFPTYHFAVVIDDELMGVTHVLRAQEHLINTPKHVALQGALTRLPVGLGGRGHPGEAFRVPAFAHMPLIFNIDGTKMSKRDKAKTARKALKDFMAKDATLSPASLASTLSVDAALLQGFIDADNDSLDIAQIVAAHFKIALPEIEVWDYRKSGYLPRAITNFLSLLGWSTGAKDAQGKDVEKFDNAFLAEHFALERIGKTPAKFDRVKLLSFNADAIAALSDADFTRELFAWADEWEPDFARALRATPDARRAVLFSACKARCKTLRDAIKVMEFALVSDDAMTFDPIAMEKAALGADGAGRAPVEAFAAMLQGSSVAISSADVDAWIKQYAETNQRKMGEVAQPLRVALTGTTVSPPLGDVAAVLGRDGSLRRIERCLAH
ncbi:MAG: hypothetical protein K2X32_07580, partial [Phycisphaerales bacterium]|nr:hypothetical protein [Phycisphaerales bacterium]